MTLTADSGSTKTAWYIDNRRVDTQGLNPLTTDDDAMTAAFAEVAKAIAPCEPDEVRFYGAGCGTEESCRRVERLLRQAFTKAKVTVGSDLLGACRACYGNEVGMTGILGTGSNVCYYDGRGIKLKGLSLGYILGDEGSGNHIGRMLLKEAMEQRMPKELREEFVESYKLDYPTVIEHLYRTGGANRWLASLAPFAALHKDEPYMKELLERCFEAYFDHQVIPLERQARTMQLPMSDRLRLVGSVADAFGELLTAIAKRRGIAVDCIIKAPTFYEKH
ncbi:MAG: ATPase [Bacteroidales bacterium]|nr:ATPase [Bacteroidales bacterium]